MDQKNGLHPPICKGEFCDFAVDTSTESGLCIDGMSSCIGCNLLEAEPSNFHDNTLIEATAKIRQIISEIPEDPNGRKLSFFITEDGILMAWASHGETVPANAVTRKDGREAVAQALKLKVQANK